MRNEGQGAGTYLYWISGREARGGSKACNLDRRFRGGRLLDRGVCEKELLAMAEFRLDIARLLLGLGSPLLPPAANCWVNSKSAELGI